MSDDTRDDAFRAWWKGYATQSGLGTPNAIIRTFAKVVWAAAWAAGQEGHRQEMQERIERLLLERLAEKGAG